MIVCVSVYWKIYNKALNSFFIFLLFQMIKLYDWENDKLVWTAQNEEEAIWLITKFLQDNCQWEDWISDLEIEMNYNEFNTLNKQCEHYNFYFITI